MKYGDVQHQFWVVAHGTRFTLGRKRKRFVLGLSFSDITCIVFCIHSILFTFKSSVELIFFCHLSVCV